MNLVTPDATPGVRSTFPVSPPPPVLFARPTSSILSPPLLSSPICSFHDAEGEERFRYKSSGIEKPLIVACPSFFPTLANISFLSLSLLFVSFKILYRFGGDYTERGKVSGFPGFLLLSHVGFECCFLVVGFIRVES